MKALLPSGGPELVESGEVDQPRPLASEALMQVEAFSVNRGETFLLEKPPTDWRPGKDIAGLVVQAAADGSGPPAGRRVVGHPPAAAGPSTHASRLSRLPYCPRMSRPSPPPRCRSPD